MARNMILEATSKNIELEDTGEEEAWTRAHLLDVDELSRDELAQILATTAGMEEVLQRPVARTPALRGTTIFNLFYEPSTRTRSSFELAGKVLGADVINLSVSGSSIEKGESLVDTIRTLGAIGGHIIVIRHPASGSPYLAARHSHAHIVNAGDGLHAHPTQAILDAYTIQKALGSVESKKICIVGDIRHSRVARSNIWALTTLGAEVTLVAPATLIPPGIHSTSEANTDHFSLPPVHIDHDLDRAITNADVVIALRLQRERMQSSYLPSLHEYVIRYQITKERLSHAANNVIVMHPGPVNEGVEISPEIANGDNSQIQAQIEHGVAVRMAVLYLLSRTNQ